MYVEFDEWTRSRSLASLGTNAGADELPFQNWRKFKESFAPELVRRAIDESAIPVSRGLDPFGGSGTTALACQFLGVRPVTVEVNPFLADLIEAKLARYDTDKLAKDIGTIARLIPCAETNAASYLRHLPSTFVEPGVSNRWIFDEAVALRIASFLAAIDQLNTPSHRRLFRVLLGGIVVGVSNILISGKGRRYRRGWETRRRPATSVDDAFYAAAHTAITEIHTYSRRRERDYEIIRGDCRNALSRGHWDLAVFSPPYPNSFDYTDVYNVELWMLGYLRSFEANRDLRQSTLSSHVQISRAFRRPPKGSSALDRTMVSLRCSRNALWDRRIPEMVGAYFADLSIVLRRIRSGMPAGGSTWLVVGDSQYAGIPVETATIIAQLASERGWALEGVEPFRSMRLSPQQGGKPELAETLIKLRRHN